MVERKFSVPQLRQAVQASRRERTADRFRGAQDLAGLLFSDINMHLGRGIPERAFQRIGRVGFQKGDHVLLIYQAGVPVVVLEKLRFDVQGPKLHFRKASVSDQSVACAEGRGNQCPRQPGREHRRALDQGIRTELRAL